MSSRNNALTNADRQLGPSTTFKVQAGDSVTLQVFATYENEEVFNHLPFTDALLGSLSQGVNGGVLGLEGGALSAGVLQGVGPLLSAVTGQEDEPKAYLQFVLLDESFQLQDVIDVNQTYAAVTGNFDPDENNFEKLSLQVQVPEDGYIYAYIVNESDKNIHWDDFTFSVVGTRAIRKTDYYPFGAVAKVWNNPDQTQRGTYRHGYQGQYAEADTTTGWNAFELRMYDPLIGRWLQVDPVNQFASPYLAMGNNPINTVDPDGGTCFDNNGNPISCPEGFEQYNAVGNDMAGFLDEVVVSGIGGVVGGSYAIFAGGREELRFPEYSGSTFIDFLNRFENGGGYELMNSKGLTGDGSMARRGRASAAIIDPKVIKWSKFETEGALNAVKNSVKILSYLMNLSSGENNSENRNVVLAAPGKEEILILQDIDTNYSIHRTKGLMLTIDSIFQNGDTTSNDLIPNYND